MIFLKNIIKDEHIFIKPKLKDKKSLFEFIADKAFLLKLIDDKNNYLNDLWERENKMSTEIAKGIAIPHVKSASVIKDFIIVIISPDGIKYGGFKSKVNIVFAIGTSTKAENYINVMAKIARFLNQDDFKQRLLRADVPQDVLLLINEFENTELIKIQRETKEHFLVGLIINNSEHESKVEEILLEAGLRNTTIIDSEYGIKKILYNIPFLRSFMLYGKTNSTSKTIIGFTCEKDFVSKIVGIFKNEGIDFEKKGEGVLFMIKLMEMIGAIDEDIDI